jgi:hypothetical protein
MPSVHRTLKPRLSAIAAAVFVELERLYRADGIEVSLTTEDSKRECIKEFLPLLSERDRAEVLQTVPPETLLAGLTPEQIQQYLDRLSAQPAPPKRKPQRKK